MPKSDPIFLFDVMDTLVTDPFFDAIPSFFGMTLGQLLDEKHPDSWIAFEKAEITEDQYLASFFADGRDIDKSALRRLLWEHYEWLPGMEVLVAELHAAGYQLHALSNYSTWYRIIEEKLKLSRFVHWTFVSAATGLRKPDEACYRFACQSLAVEPGDCLFIDDRQINVDAAKQIGMGAVRMQGVDALRRELELRGV